MEDRLIVGLYWQRDERAIDETKSKYERLLMTISNNILGNRDDALECVNDTYLQAWNSIPPNKPDPLSAFLAKITRNLSLNRYKHLHREKRGGNSADAVLDELSEIVSGNENVEGELDKQELVRAINSFLSELSEQKRNIFIRRYWYADSVMDIAEDIGMSQGNVSSILMRTRAKLKKYLEERGFTV